MGPAHGFRKSRALANPTTSILHHTNLGSNVLLRIRAFNDVAIAVLFFANDLFPRIWVIVWLGESRLIFSPLLAPDDFLHTSS
jgi:hypothetical protein